MLVFYHNGSKLSNSSLDKLIDKHKQCAKGRILPTLPLDVIRCIFDISTYGPTYRSLLFTCWNIYNEFILKKNAYFEYEVSKMFNIMQKEYYGRKIKDLQAYHQHILKLIVFLHNSPDRNLHFFGSHWLIRFE